MRWSKYDLLSYCFEQFFYHFVITSIYKFFYRCSEITINYDVKTAQRPDRHNFVSAKLIIIIIIIIIKTYIWVP